MQRTHITQHQKQNGKTNKQTTTKRIHNNSTGKSAEELNRHFPLPCKNNTKHADGQHTNEKVLDITNYQGYTNQSHNKMLPRTF